MAFTRTYDGPEPVRINKWLGQTGVCSRREADALIADGLVSIDGEVVEDVGRKILPGQTLTLAEAATSRLDANLSVLFHKPVGVVSSQPDPGQIPAVRLLTRQNLFGHSDVIPDRDSKLAPCGRLDMDSRGLLILSEDGVLAKALIGPESQLEKEYIVRVIGEITAKKIKELSHGMWLDDRPLKPAEVRSVADNTLRFVLHEGRNRQIRRMCELVGLAVRDLFRVRIGPLWLGDLPEGRWRVITPEERAALIKGAAGG
jgi:23S rRNA pseudouridine2604 synthase